MDNNDGEDFLNNSNSYLDNGNFFFFDNAFEKDNIFFNNEYQNFNDDNNHCISVKEEDEKFNDFGLDPDDYPYLKNKTEVQKKQVKTKSRLNTGSINKMNTPFKSRSLHGRLFRVYLYQNSFLIYILQNF